MVLVLASGDTPFFDQDRRVWQLYRDRHPEIKVFMVYGYPFPKDAGVPQSDWDLYYPDIPAYPEIPASDVPPIVHQAMIQKTVRAMRFLDERYTYDWFLRTNISTFWNWFELLAHVRELPLHDCYSGDGPFLDEYLSGYDTLVNGYMVKEFLKHTDRVLNDGLLHEDHALGRVFHTIMGAPFLPPRIHFMERFRITSTRDDIRRSIFEGMARHADHYRVKNVDEGVRRRRAIEESIYRELLLAIYGITDSFAVTMTEEHLQEEATQLALHEEKTRVIADWIAAHGTPEQRARQAAGALPMDEAIQAMIDDVFAPLSKYEQYEQYVHEGVDRVQPHFSSALLAQASATIGRGEIAVTSAPVARMTASQSALVQQIKILMPEATVVVRTHTMAWRRIPHLALTPSFGVLVTQRVGPFIFGREYATAV
jgi:hypothetical protein